MDQPETLNILAVIVGTIVAFLFGWLIYSPKVFGTKGAEGSGVELGAASSMPVFAMAAQPVALFLLALVIGAAAATSALGTALLAILAAAAFVVSSGAFVKKSTCALAVDGGYIVGSGALMIPAQGLLCRPARFATPWRPNTPVRIPRPPLTRRSDHRDRDGPGPIWQLTASL